MYTSEIHSFENSNYNVKNYEIRTQLACEEIWQEKKIWMGGWKTVVIFYTQIFLFGRKKDWK